MYTEDHEFQALDVASMLEWVADIEHNLVRGLLILPLLLLPLQLLLLHFARMYVVHRC
jgi:hypothetical protein